jgi:hypothetical protein
MCYTPQPELRLMNPLLSWLSKATAEQRKALASSAGLSAGSLHQMSRAYRTDGVLRITPEIAARLEKASLKFPIRPQLKREDLSPACGACDLARQCRTHNQD